MVQSPVCPWFPFGSETSKRLLCAGSSPAALRTLSMWAPVRARHQAQATCLGSKTRCSSSPSSAKRNPGSLLLSFFKATFSSHMLPTSGSPWLTGPEALMADQQTSQQTCKPSRCQGIREIFLLEPELDHHRRFKSPYMEVRDKPAIAQFTGILYLPEAVAPGTEANRERPFCRRDRLG